MQPISPAEGQDLCPGQIARSHSRMIPSRLEPWLHVRAAVCVCAPPPKQTHTHTAIHATQLQMCAWMHAATRCREFPADSSDLAAGAAGDATFTVAPLRRRPVHRCGSRPVGPGWRLGQPMGGGPITASATNVKSAKYLPSPLDFCLDLSRFFCWRHLIQFLVNKMQKFRNFDN